MSNLQTGFDGEAVAAAYLQTLEYKIVETNYRSNRWGELDIVCLHEDDLVFVEVRTRTNQRYGQPIESITPGKLLRLHRAAEYYKLTHPQTPDSMRFDVVTVDSQGVTQVYRNVER